MEMNSLEYVLNLFEFIPIPLTLLQSFTVYPLTAAIISLCLLWQVPVPKGGRAVE